MKTAKALGFVKGDFVLIGGQGGFVGILVSDVHTSTPLCEVWGIEHEAGSVYAEQLQKIPYSSFIQNAWYRDAEKIPFTKEAKKALGVK